MKDGKNKPTDGRASALEASCRELMEALPAAIYTTDAAGRITYFNQAAADLAGRAPQLGSDQWCVSWRQFRPDGTPLPHDECPMAVALKEGRAVRGEELLVERPDGARIAVMPYPSPLHDASGRVMGAVNMLVDLTDRQNADKALHRLNAILARSVENRTAALKDATAELAEASARLDASERSFQLLVQGVTDYAIFMLDPDGIVTSWNAGAEGITGYRVEEIVGAHFSRLYTEEDRARWLPGKALDLARTEGRCEMEGWRVQKDGRRFWASVVIDPIRDDSGTLIGFAKITRDETERRLAEERLTESAELATGIIDTALDAFVQIDETGFVREWNAQAEAVFGWSRAEAIGADLWRLIVPAAHADRYRGWLARYLRNERTRAAGRRLRLRAQRSDGAEIVVELSVTALRRGEGFVINGFIRDVTEKLTLEAQLRHAQKMEALGQMIGGVAHDFNNLLMAIIGNLEVLAAKLPEHGSYRRYVEAALRAGWRGSGLTEKLLAFSRRKELHPEVVSVERLLRGAIMLCQKTVGEGVEITVRATPELWSARLDPGQFEAALLNLAANARDAMEWSGRLAVAAENAAIGPKPNLGLRGGDYVVVSVADDGCGMAPDVVARAFEPFYTTKEAGRGTGLGLSQVYGFARQCGGAVGIESRKGFGTTVRLYLPRAEGEVSPERAVDDLAAAQSGSATVLVVEDDEDVREMVVEVVSHLGYRVLAATNGREALSMLERDRSVDLLFSDVVMPSGLSGIELGRGARRLRPGLSVLLTSGYVGEAARSELIRSGFSFISKPYRPAELATKLAECLRAGNDLTV